MAKFRFSLQALLTLRRREEEVLERQLSALLAEKQRLEEELRSRQRELTAGKAELRAVLVGPLDAPALRHHAASAMAVDRLARRTVLALAGQAERIAAARALVVEAARRRRAVELLREKRLEEWHRVLDKKETALLDELGAIQANAARREALEGALEEANP